MIESITQPLGKFLSAYGAPGLVGIILFGFFLRLSSGN